MQSIRMDENTLVEKGIKKTAAWMKSSKKIIFFGVGTTYDFLQETKGIFLPMGKDIYYANTIDQIKDIVDNETVMIAICYSGTTKDVLEAVDIAILKGVKVVGITGFKDAPIVGNVHLPLICALSLNPFNTKGVGQDRSLIDIVQKIGVLYEVEI
jgi:DNA-binding MurR/RpiR family transcriptional regulator